MSETLTAAIRLLARREHGEHELLQKLTQKGHALPAAKEAILECQRLGLQSDHRFVENSCRVRIRQGYGPVYISQALRQLGLDDTLVQSVLLLYQDNWLSYARAVWEKKYQKQCSELTYAALQKQKQFLRYRGFSTDTINALFKTLDEVVDDEKFRD